MLAAGTVLGAFRLEDLVAHGGMGSVYRARDDRLGRIVALTDSHTADRLGMRHLAP